MIPFIRSSDDDSDASVVQATQAPRTVSIFRGARQWRTWTTPLRSSVFRMCWTAENCFKRWHRHWSKRCSEATTACSWLVAAVEEFYVAGYIAWWCILTKAYIVSIAYHSILFSLNLHPKTINMFYSSIHVDEGINQRIFSELFDFVEKPALFNLCVACRDKKNSTSMTFYLGPVIWPKWRKLFF